MAFTRESLRVYLTGGAANTDPNASLGGDKSDTELAGQDFVVTTALSGVTLEFVTGFPLGGENAISFAVGLPVVQMQGFLYDGTETNFYDVGDGVWVLPADSSRGRGVARFNIDTTGWVNGTYWFRFTCTDHANALFSDTPAIDSKFGKTRYRCVMVTTGGAAGGDSVNLRTFFESLSGVAGLMYGWGAPGGVGIPPPNPSIPDQYTEPVDTPPIVWQSSLTEGVAIPVTTGSGVGGMNPLWLKHTTPASTSEGGTSALHVAIRGDQGGANLQYTAAMDQYEVFPNLVQIQSVFYRAIITGGAGDYEFRASSFQLFLNLQTITSTINLIGPLIDINEIESRIDGRLKLERYTVFRDGFVANPLEIADFPFSDFRYDEGPSSASITLIGISTYQNPAITTKALTKISNERLLDDGSRTWNVGPADRVLPGDTVILPDTLENVLIGSIRWIETPRSFSYQIKEALP